MHSTIERQLRKNVINDHHCKNARRNPKPYKVKYLNCSFFKDFFEFTYFSSIRPGYKVDDPVVTDLKQVKYTHRGLIEYKLCHNSNEWQSLNKRNKKPQESGSSKILAALYKDRKKIKKENY